MENNTIQNNIEELNLNEISEFFRLKLSLSNALPYFFGSFIANHKSLFNLKTYFGFIPVLLVSISGCLLNDIRDYKSDLKNPKKSDKPLITGKVSLDTAFKFGILFLIISFVLSLFCNLGYFLIGLIGISLPIAYYFLKEIVPFDFLIDSFLLIVPISAGWYLTTDKIFPIKIFAFFILYCIQIYLHGAIYDFEVDEISTVKTIGLYPSWIILFLSMIFSVIIIPKHRILVLIDLLILNVIFIIVNKFRKWDIYTISLILTGAVLFPILAF